MADPTTPTTPDPIDALMEKPEYHHLVMRIRQYARDYAPLNRIVKGEESSNRDILLAIALTIDDINATPPPLTKELAEMIRIGWAPLIIVGAIIHLLQSLVLHYARNDLPFNDGGVMTQGLSSKAPVYQGILDRLTAWYENFKLKAKVSANLAELMGITPSGVPSEFSLIHGLGRTWSY